KCELEMHRRMNRFAFLDILDLGTSGHPAPIRRNSALGWRQFGFFLGNQNMGCGGWYCRRRHDGGNGNRKSCKPTSHEVPPSRKKTFKTYYRVPPSPMIEYGAHNKGC